MALYKACVDLHLILRQGDKILLGLRQNTGFADGSWHLPSGHAEDGESATIGVIREAKEEIGVDVQPSDVRFVHFMHHRTDSGRVGLFYESDTWTGDVVNTEPDKCAEWRWFPISALPEQMIPYAAEVLVHIAKEQRYSERGW
ncbi:MAG: NUDIX hydrolase [Mycobacteriales bacterium]